MYVDIPVVYPAMGDHPTCSIPRRGILGYYLHSSYRQRTLGVYEQRQRAMEGMARTLTRGAPRDNTLVFYGNKSCGAGGCISRWLGGAPHKAFRQVLNRHAMVVAVEEHLTSQFCSGCVGASIADQLRAAGMAPQPERRRAAATLPPPRTLQQIRQCKAHKLKGVKFAGRSRRYKVMRCPMCDTVWQRDVSAARNIMHVGLWSMVGLPNRPPVLARKQQQQQQQQHQWPHAQGEGHGLEPHQLEAEVALNNPANYE